MILWTVGIVLALYIIICVFFYFFQEKLIFYPTQLEKAYQFGFREQFREVNIPTTDGTNLHGLLFKAPASKGLVFYLHGNAGAVSSWGQMAYVYTSLQYDVFILDYRGFGKSEGSIVSEAQFYEDVQTAYDQVKKNYSEQHIIIIGFSIGSASAARLAARNNPGMLILQAPYYSLTNLMQHISPAAYAILPPFVFKYKFITYQFVEETKAPIVIFHGDKDEVIYYGSSLKLKEHLKPIDELVTLTGQRHNGINENAEYIRRLRSLLAGD
ncbi:alpha/beta fold hydrolase [Rhodocytophaga rosea]|uniref:Alpha/beta fold hydrolase n=1 Tax=Rhodocytophaga rosea TaxID=2704465 RepID=A0A6C0GPW0_9BACT|nr:alpha/beta fold hydrolase [Rhodocytophaga rosea]QHT70096.1 alpha/beta fold hydrolase [Rhodocytophaga rosea]